jgi:Type-F conjugative transfer system protein (TrbI_Ftype)
MKDKASEQGSEIETAEAVRKLGGGMVLSQMLLIAVGTVAMSVILSLALTRSLTPQKSIVVLDVNKIFNAKRKQFTNAYKDRDPSSGDRLRMQRDIDDFTEKFNNAVQNESRRHIILYKESVVSTDTVPDITDEVMKAVQ